jgi:hypothetical protein
MMAVRSTVDRLRGFRLDLAQSPELQQVGERRRNGEYRSPVVSMQAMLLHTINMKVLQSNTMRAPGSSLPSPQTGTRQ